MLFNFQIHSILILERCIEKVASVGTYALAFKTQNNVLYKSYLYFEVAHFKYIFKYDRLLVTSKVDNSSVILNDHPVILQRFICY